MKKNRNTFFQESSYQSYKPMAQQMGGAPYQTASNYFYQGPMPNAQPMPNNYTTQMPSNDIESRLAKIERQLNRLDYRLSKLENASNTITSDDFDTTTNNTTNMYML